MILLPPRHRPSPFPRQVRAQTRECEHTPADTQRRSQASTWRCCRRWVVAWAHRRREVLGTGVEPVPWARGCVHSGVALRPGAYELKKPGIIRANYTCAHSRSLGRRRGGRTGHPSHGLTPAILPSVGGGASGCGSEEEGWGPVGGEPPASGVGVSPLPPKRGPHHTPGALQPGTPGDGGVAELEARTRIGVRVPLVLC